jgi:SAM-dependent methyltransferase
MARPRKPIRPEDLRKAYLEMGLSTTEISSSSQKLLGTKVTAATIYNHLVRLGIPVRSKSEGVSRSKSKEAFIRLTDISGRHKTNGTRWNTRYWNARWLVSTGKVRATNSKLTKDQASLLSKLLDEYGESNALPEHVVDESFDQVRRDGFPYMVMDSDEMSSSWKRLVKSVPRKDDGSYHWVGTDTTLATMFHPHLYECRKKGKMSPVELFESDEDLRRAIRKAYCLHGKISRRIINDICRNEDASGRVGNFPPRVGKAIIRELCEDRTGMSVLDPCAGFGGRLFACAASGSVGRYVGIDLSKKTYDGLLKSVEFLKSVGCGMEVNLRNSDCVSELSKIDDSFDLVMTSPPFFDVEEYVGVGLPTDYAAWFSGFMEPMMRLCSERLRLGGRMAFYIENVGKHRVPEDCLSASGSMGLRVLDPIHFVMNFGASRRREAGKGINILVWEKIER